MDWFLTQAGDKLVGCLTEPVDRIETRPFDPEITNVHTHDFADGCNSKFYLLKQY